MQRSLESLNTVLAHFTDVLHALQQSRSSSALPPDPVTTQILRWQDEGLTLRAIAARLNAEGVPTRSGKGRWHQSNISRELARLRQ